MIRTLAAIGVFASLVSAQNKGSINPQHVPPSMMYHRVWAVTPLQGAGTPGDPQRPMFVPSTAPAANDRSGILGYQMWLSDDGKSALVEMVFASPATFQAVLQKEAAARGIAVAATHAPTQAGNSAAQTALENATPGLKMFERGKATQDQVLAEFQKHKTGFQFNASTVRVP